jgi:hypothetical protein
MKKWILITVILCAAFFLFGCEETATESDDNTQDTTNTTNTTTETSNTENDIATAPNDDEMATIFEEAYTVYQWFDLEALTVKTDSEGNVIFYTVDDNPYCEKVDDAAISSMNELKAAVRQYFSTDLAESMINSGRYFESDGILYAIAADRGSDITRGDVLSKVVTDRSDTSVTYTITVETVDPETGEPTGSENIDYLYEYIDGEWLFTTFESIY